MVSSSWFRARFISLAWLEDPTTWQVIRSFAAQESQVKKMTCNELQVKDYLQLIYFCEKNIVWHRTHKTYSYDWNIILNWVASEVLAKWHRASAAVPGHVGSVNQLQHQMFFFPFLPPSNHKNGKHDPFLVSAQYCKVCCSCTCLAQQLKTHHI